MKTRLTIGGLLITLISFQASAQQVENDDLYFNSKDRARLKSTQAESSINTNHTSKKKKNTQAQAATEVEESVNPMDSYSRNVNPEYISRSNSEQASENEESYYVEGYTPSTNTYDSYSGSQYPTNNYYNNSNYGYSPYSGNSSYYNPYYGYGNSWMNPYNSNGWSLSLSYYWGNSWGSGWNYGMNYGYGSYYNPYAYYPSYYSPYYSNWGYPYNYYSSNSYEKSRVNYGKRPSMNSAIVRPTKQVVQNNSIVTNTSRVRTRKTADEYYVKPFRRMQTTGGTTNNSNDSFFQQRNSSGNQSRTRTTFDRQDYSSPSRNNNSFSSPSRSFSSPNHSGGGSSRPRSRN